ncbi:rcc01693 family protein [Pseudotabrizicola algicola]|uniref:Phage tail assembly chaperone n=1 Tax=Pseudotabrizicola algicola TaxID=2709381 RepID=A0A6B3RNU9_9RHOB|nr:rcc01693 family protein [Pseudotabrizicola algicola]NEX44759.1 phage tail assembly chaperone [Pseudotabrizicola algicola]
MSGIDWPGLIRVGLHRLGLQPEAFWRLTPVELRVMLGADVVTPPLTRARLAELSAAFPDISKETDNGADRRPGGSGCGA